MLTCTCVGPTLAAATATAAAAAAAVLPRVKANKASVTSLRPLPDNANPILGPTADGLYHVRFYLENGKVVIKDAQGNTARVVKPDIDAGYSVIHGIDKVMLSGKCLVLKIDAGTHVGTTEVALLLNNVASATPCMHVVWCYTASYSALHSSLDV
jgi:hypothetical protein